MCALMVSAGRCAASSAAVASSIVNRWVTSDDRSMPVCAMKRSVSGQTPGEPIEPVMVSSFDWMSPSLAGASRPTSMPM